MTAAILCGVAVYMVGYTSGEITGQESVSKMYTQGYRTGYIKGFRRFRKELISHPDFQHQPVNPMEISLSQGPVKVP